MKAAIFDLDGTLLRPAPWPVRLFKGANRPADSFRRHAEGLVATHRRCGHLTVLLTAAREEFAQVAWRKLQADVVLPVPAGPDEDWMRLKVVHEFIVRYGLSARESFGYSGQWCDVHWLDALGHPVAVHPGWRLRRHAIARGWRRMNLDSPMPVNL